MPREPEVQDTLRRALGMLKAAEHFTKAALGQYVIRQRWQPGQPIDATIRQLQAVQAGLERSATELNDVLSREPERPKRKKRTRRR